MCEQDADVSQGKSFCCVGCRTVYELLQANNLCGYYNFEKRGTPLFKIAPHSRFDFLDDETIRPQLIQFSDGIIARTTLRLPRIHCASCIWLLENLFKINPAILRAEVNFLKKEIAITFREQEIKLSEIATLLTKLGYEPEIQLDAQTVPNQTTNKQRKLYLQVGLAGFAFGNVMIFSFPDYLDSTGILSAQFKYFFGWLSIALATPVLLFSASDYFISSWYALHQRKISLDVPVALGMSALYFRSVFDIVSGHSTGYLDSFTGLVFFLLIGKIFQQKTFAALSFDRDYASYFPLSIALIKDKNEVYVPVAKLKKDDEIFVRNHEIVPADSRLLSSHASIDYSFVTGESVPVLVNCGELVYAGGRIVGAGANFSVVKEVSHSYLTQLWNHETFRKIKGSSLLTVSDTFGKYFTLLVGVIAIASALFWLPDVDKAVNVFTAVLIIACPCALTLAAPFTLGAAVTIFGKAKFYLKNIGVVVDLAAINSIVFDKTGTLTTSESSKAEFNGTPLTAKEITMIATCLKSSTHPLSRQILASLPSSLNFIPAKDLQEIAHCGISGNVDGHSIAVGSASWISKLTIFPTLNRASSVHIAIDGMYRGYFHFRNSYREGLTKLLSRLSIQNELYLLSGDNDSERTHLSSHFPARHLSFYQSPEDKLRFVKSLQAKQKNVAMIGDGLNDAGALQQSNVGIAISEDTSAFTPACDAILAAQHLHQLPEYFAFARYALRILMGCFLLSLVYNFVGLSFAVSGKLSPLITAILMPISSLSVVVIAWGAMKIRAPKLFNQNN